MEDRACVEFLRWALPRLRLRWEGFRKVRRQIRRRLARRLQALALPDLDAYRAYLGAHPEEWETLDSLCTISVARFYRDRSLWAGLADVVLPRLAQDCAASGRDELGCWSAGCASGEEPYTLTILWAMQWAPRLPKLRLRVLATDLDAALLNRAERARYSASSLKELPDQWLEAAFTRSDSDFFLRPEFREGVELRRADLRGRAPDAAFDLILCRNLAFTYFDQALQREVLARLVECLRPGGALVVGSHEQLPEGAERTSRLVGWDDLRSIYRREAARRRTG